jgi:selenocysteine-specific elongation factor
MIIATAGHIDHGKTSLVGALTGAETDRLPEERARGISIDLGFAHWRPESDLSISFVDVPGHERFIRNMLAGVAGVDSALIVVAADDGVMPQTIEHVQILDLLGISRGVVAITKADRANADRIAEVRYEVEQLLDKTSLALAPIVETSSITGSGVAELGRLLTDAARSDPSRVASGRNFRMAIDRAFTVIGAGTVVTGTILEGKVGVGDRLVLSSNGMDARVRGIQRTGETVHEASAGQRCALNLAGIELDHVRRGDWLLVQAMNAPSRRMSARLRVVGNRGQALKHDTRVHLHIATADIAARVLTPGQKPVARGSNLVVQLALDEPVVAVVGDRFVIRDQSGRQLIGGGHVISPAVDARRSRRVNHDDVVAALEKGSPEQALRALLAIEAHETDVAAFGRSFNLTADRLRELLDDAGAVALGATAISGQRADRIREKVTAALSAFHREWPQAMGIPVRDLHQKMAEQLSRPAFAALLKSMASAGVVEATASRVKLHGHSPAFSALDAALWQKLLPWLEERGPRPFTVAELVKETRSNEAFIQAMLFGRRSSNDVWRINKDQFLLGTHVAGLAASAARLTEETRSEGFTAAEYRDASGIGRNLTIKVLEFFDAIRVTARRAGKRHVVKGYKEIVGSAPAFWVIKVHPD